jgi:sulfide:quinone oxidoreductase
MAESRVVIAGGGVGGVVTARELRRKLGRSVHVTLIDRRATHLFQPSLLWVMTGKRKPRDITRSLARLERKGIEVINAEVTAIDPARKTVVAGGKEISGDYLVIALGAELAPELVPGLAEAGHNLYTLEGAESARDERLKVDSGQVVSWWRAPPTSARLRPTRLRCCSRMT